MNYNNTEMFFQAVKQPTKKRNNEQYPAYTQQTERKAHKSFRDMRKSKRSMWQETE